MQQDIEMAPLSEFFSRPIQIAHFTWSGLTGYLNFDPWSAFFTNVRVANRLNNYHLLRATLKVKFVINGNPFLYGRMIAAYTPYIPFEGSGGNQITRFDLFEDIVQSSQLPHIFINPTSSEGGIITCPFFHNNNYLRITTSEFVGFGNIHMFPLTQLRHANDPSFVPPTISVFAWAEDVQLSVLTSVDTSTLLPQAGEIDEANSRGFISGPATTVARVANALRSVPVIAPYAKATEMASSTIASVAAAFGYSRPTVTKVPDTVKLLQSSSFALTNVPDTSQKLSVDHKQEATVDPRISGIEQEDMLSIVNIAKRESYWNSFTWDTSAVTGDLLWNGRVTPVCWLIGPYGEFHFPATAMAAMPFRYWTGTLNYRFQIVCTGFHKGRLAVSWDPNFLAAGASFNTMYTEIIDIAETQDFTISISNGQPYTMIENTWPGSTATSEVSSNTRYLVPEKYANGVIGVSVVNGLTTPSENGMTIAVNVFISAGEDFKVFVPDDYFNKFVVFNQSAPTFSMAQVSTIEEPVSEAPVEPAALQEQAGMLTTGDANDNAPVGDNYHPVYTAEHSDYTNLVYTGETITSFRSLLKRFSLWRCLMAADQVGYRTMNYRFSIFPFIRGYYSAAPDFAGGVPYAFCNTLLIHWITLSFAGFRGNFRYKVVPRYRCLAGYPITYYAQRFSNELDGGEYSTPTGYAQADYTTPAAAARTVFSVNNTNHAADYVLGGPPGLAYGNSDTGVFEFELPWYSPQRFAGGRHKPWAAGDTFGAGGFYLQIKGYQHPKDLYDLYVATGEDFQTYFFLGLPRMKFEPQPPAL